jgi:hypothetical protein
VLGGFARFHVEDLLDLLQEPGIDLGSGMHFRAHAERMAWATLSSRSGVGVPMAARMAFLSSPSPSLPARSR